MEQMGYIALAVGAAAVVLAATGWWRRLFGVFAIRRGRMTIERLGFTVHSPLDIERVNGILTSFAGGFNAMITRPSARGWVNYCNSLPVLYRPFAHEGAAMGHTLRRFFRYDPAVFETEVVRPHQGFKYLHYVGLGFWSGMRNHDPQRLRQVVEGLDPVYGHLCYDGFGFKHGFFDYLKDRACLRRLDSLPGYARNAAYHGVGRSFWFIFMGDHHALIQHIHGLGEHASDGAAGLGLGTVFVYPDGLEIAQNLGRKLPTQWHDHFHLGMCFGLKARSINDEEQFARDVGKLDDGVQEAIGAAISACDRAEGEVRSEGGQDSYRRWRERVTQWMAGHLEYPLAGVKPTAARAADRQPATA